MSNPVALYSSASLEAANATPFSSTSGTLEPALLQALAAMKFNFMTPVQEAVLSKLPSMHSDCLVQAKTGTGKTIAFLLPALQNLRQSSTVKGQVSILILSPTRELALQIASEAQRLASKFQPPVHVHTAFGGTAKASALEKFKREDPNILVATPGRLNDYLSEANVRAKFKNMKTLILDEADRMLDQGFLPDILRILNALPPKSGHNGQWQGMCFSATIPPKMEKVFSHVLTKGHTTISTIDKTEPPTLTKVPQYSVIIPTVAETFTSLFSLLKEELRAVDGVPRIIVFGTTANLVAMFARVFEEKLGLPVHELHSRLSQPARTRVTDLFKDSKNAGVLFASDVIGRGMDFADVSLIIQVGLPLDSDAYTHRVGRTARAGKDGRAVIILTQQESYFLHTNPQFPINPYPHADRILSGHSAQTNAHSINARLETIDPNVKRKAYSAYLGFMKGFVRKLRIEPEGLVKMANEFAVRSMMCDEVPEMDKKTVGKMGLKGVSGIRYAKNTLSTQNQDAKRVAPRREPDPPSRRLKHQDMPEAIPKPAPTRQPAGGSNPGRGRGRGRGRGNGGGGRGGRGGVAKGANSEPLGRER
ncbi:uncharacterized protein KY384_001715 [Bacidia gigantensis]|uniref:uncharacterized protein n=1 Tax=Bacidia gigantensis TaxID=2732470 RepID=UPI001D036732|nr:uncharacterized protein KY384_001715 [Bacidia gigantensis]KAG8533972.1 hypothetical protein KY384_001715 [Bacidia gigantensis]